MDSENSTLILSINELLPGYNSNNTLTRNKGSSKVLLFLQSLDLNLWKYGTPTLYCIGSVGNLLTIMVLTRPSMRSGSSVMLMALAVADTLTLAIGPTSRYFQNIHNVYLNDYFIICKFHKYLKSVFGYIANWLVIVFTIFRVIAVYWPHKANVFCTRKRALIAVTATFVTCCLIHLDYVIHIQRFVHVNNRGNFAPKKCWFEGSRDIYYKEYSQWVMLTFMSIIPFFVLFLGNVMIVRKVLIYSIKRKRMSNDVKSSDSQSMTAMLIGISVLFLITQVPAVVISIIKRNLSNETHSKEYLYRFLVIDTIFRLFKWTNHAVNFFCYCVSGKRFREELVAIVPERFRRKRQCDNSVVTKTSTVTPSYPS